MKRHLFSVFFAFLIIILSACTDQSDCCTNVALSIDVELQNSDGSDMLNSSTSGYIGKQDISVFYEIDGKLETYASLNNGAILDNPEGFVLQSDGTNSFLHIFSNPTVGSNVMTIVRITNRPDIELIAQVESNHGKQITNLWFEDQLVWSTVGSESAPRVVVKVD